MKYIIIAAIAILVLLAVYILLTYNVLVTRRNMVHNQKSQIDIELQRRFDLIPNLVEVVKGYANHEKTTLEDVVNARSTYSTAKADTAQALAADQALSNALQNLFILAEAYPDLKANTNFMNLQTELANTEKKIAFSRQFYNDSVFLLNTNIDKFPSNIVATLFRFKKDEYFQTTDESRKNVTIDL